MQRPPKVAPGRPLAPESLYTRKMKGHTERELLLELFPATARELFGSDGARRSTLGLYPVGEGKLALVNGDRLLELEAIEPAGKSVFHCDLCHATRSRGDALVYRAELAPRRSRYITLCAHTRHCQERAGRGALGALAEQLFGEQAR